MVARAKEVGAVSLPMAREENEAPALERLLCSIKDKASGGQEAGRGQKTVHLVKNVQPLPLRTVEAIREGVFVDFAWFPVLDEGPSDGGWKDGGGDVEGRFGGSSERRRKERKEVPDLNMWSTCFSLFQVAWAMDDPDMWVPLTGYRESIFRLARRHPWGQVARYDRRFRQEAAGRKDVKWEKEKVSLVMEIMGVSTPNRGETRQGGSGSGNGSGSGTAPRRGDPRRRGACFRFNKAEGNCTFPSCRFLHICSICGGDHPMFRCGKKGEDRTDRSALRAP